MTDRTTVDMVLEFHQAFGLGDHCAEEPTIPPASVSLVRVQCLMEEVAELARALANWDLANVLNELTDIQYFLDGTYLACGLHKVKQAAFEEVHRANMAKLWPDGKPRCEPGGRVRKPDGWRPPQLEVYVER